MKVRMAASGTLVIEAENALEAYALRMWSKDNTVLPANMLVKTAVPILPDASHAVEDIYE